jgi:hypothetical protein
MTAGLIQLASSGIENIYLTINPKMTFWESNFKRYSNFTKEQQYQKFINEPNFGNKYICRLGKCGDLIGQMVLTTTLPGINITNDLIKFAWVERVGLYLIKSVQLEINNQIIDKQFSDWLSILSEITGDITEGNKRGYNNMIGNIDSMTSYTQTKEEYTLNVPLRFWFCDKQYLPIVSLQFCNINITVEFEQLDKLYKLSPTHLIRCRDNIVCFNQGELLEQNINNNISQGYFNSFDTNTKYLYYDKLSLSKFIGVSIPQQIINSPANIALYLENSQTRKYLITGQISKYETYGDNNEISLQVEKYTLVNLNLNDTQIITDYYYLDTDEREKFINTKHTILIEQVWANLFNLYNQNEKLNLEIYNSCKYMIWITQMNSNILAKNYLNYQNINNTSNIEEQLITLNGINICDIKTELYDKVQIFKNLHRSTTKGIYMYAFSNDVNAYQPSGSINMSLMDTIQIHLRLNVNTTKQNYLIFKNFNVCYNIFIIENGLSSLLFVK